MLTQEYIDLKIKIEKKRTIIDKHSNALSSLLAKCQHEETEVKEYYFEGSYNDKAYTDYTLVCKLCGKILDETTKSHSWYG